MTLGWVFVPHKALGREQSREPREVEVDFKLGSGQLALGNHSALLASCQVPCKPTKQAHSQTHLNESAPFPESCILDP